MPPRNFTDEEEEQIAKIYLAGHSTRAIMRAYKLPGKTSILGALRRQNVKQRSPAERNRLYQIDAHAFDVIDTEEKAYWWGFIYADGCIHKRSLTVTLKASDKNHLIKLKTFLKSEHPVKIVNRYIKGNKAYKSAHYYATDRHLANRLRELGIVPKRGKFKQAITHLPKDLERHWIRGLMDGDGSVAMDSGSRGPSIGFCGSALMMNWIREILANNTGTNPDLSIQKHRIASLYYLSFSGNVVAHAVSDWLYQDATIWLSRKKKRVDNWLPVQDLFRIKKLRNRLIEKGASFRQLPLFPPTKKSG